MYERYRFFRSWVPGSAVVLRWSCIPSPIKRHALTYCRNQQTFKLEMTMAAKGAKMLKLIVSTISCVARSKCRVVRTKADAVKARLMLTAFTILSRRRNFSIESINRGCVADDGGGSNAIVVYEAADDVGYAAGGGDGDDDEEKYPDLTHSLFDEALQDLLEDTNTSVIDQVKNAKEDGENFNLEDEIDQVADLFINKFHKRMRLQKLLSFKRYQQMMERSV